MINNKAVLQRNALLHAVHNTVISITEFALQYVHQNIMIHRRFAKAVAQYMYTIITISTYAVQHVMLRSI